MTAAAPNGKGQRMSLQEAKRHLGLALMGVDPNKQDG